MRVLQTIGGFGAKGGGTSTCTYDLLSAIHNIASDVCVDLLTPSVKDPSDKLMGDNEEWIKSVENDYVTPISYSRNMSKFLRDTDYDVYHTNGMWMHINHATCAEARKKGKPYVITPHGMLYPETLARSSWRKWPVRKLWFDRDIREASCMHATCEDEMMHLRNLGYRGPVALIGNPVQVPDYTAQMIDARQNGDHIIIGFLGRLHPRKKVENIFRGLALSSDKSVKAVIIGQGDEAYESFLHQEVELLHISDRVKFAGFLRGKEKFEELSRLSALFVPSDMENFGMIIPEALIVGTPVMASLGTPWEALNTVRCGWWRDNSPESIAAVIDELASLSSEERLLMGKRGREYVIQEYSANKVAQRMLALYQWLCGKTPQPEFVYTL
ncbi:MAG: glycosyltransferase [Bacteroides sp.]|nr:glycosyltransferase [Bacteroides sp.]